MQYFFYNGEEDNKTDKCAQDPVLGKGIEHQNNVF